MSTRQAALLLVIAAVLVRPPRESRTPPTAALRLPCQKEDCVDVCPTEDRVDVCPTVASTPVPRLRRRRSHRMRRRLSPNGSFAPARRRIASTSVPQKIASTSVPQNASTSVPQECCSLDSQSQVGFSRGESEGALEFRMTQRLARNSAQRAPFWLCWSFPAVCTGSCLSFSRWRSAHSARGRASLRSDSASDAMCDWDMFHSSAPMQSRPQGAW